MSNLNQQINDYETEICDWVHLKSCTKNTNILRAIDDKITGLRRLIENSAPQKQIDDEKTENTTDSNISKTVTDLYTPIANFAWDQTENVVKIYVTIAQLKELNSNMVKVNFTSNSMSLSVTSHNRSCPSQRLNISKFFKTVLPDKCKYRLRDNMIIITLTKSEPTLWDDVKYKEPQKPSKLGNDMGESTGDPGESLMKLMKNLYEEGDDQMKRTIAKAWTESQSKQGDGVGKVVESGQHLAQESIDKVYDAFQGDKTPCEQHKDNAVCDAKCAGSKMADAAKEAGSVVTESEPVKQTKNAIHDATE